MHDQSKIAAFMALRANGWSLAKISKELNVSKATLWSWDHKHENEIHVLKHLQLERLQEKFLPSYEEELAQLRSYLERIESALEKQDFTTMTPEFLLQMSLQLRARLAKMREQVPLRTIRPNTPLEDIPVTGCISRQNAHDFRAEFSTGEHNPEDEPSNTPDTNNVAAPPESGADPVPGSPPAPGAGVGASPTPSSASHNGNGKPHLNGNGKPHSEFASVSADSRLRNRTFPNENTRGPQSPLLKTNDLQP